MRIAKIVPGAAVLAATTFGGIAAVSADTTSTDTTKSSSSQTQNAHDPSAKDGGKITTDETVVSAVTAAVQTKTAGATVDRVAKLPDGSYLAFTVQNGSKVIESLDSNYTITASKAVPANAPSDPSGSAPKQN